MTDGSGEGEGDGGEGGVKGSGQDNAYLDGAGIRGSLQ